MKNKTCRTCAAFRQIYRKGSYRYWKYRRFYCILSNRLLDEMHGCNDWRPACRREYDVSAQRLEQTEQEIFRIAELSQNLFCCKRSRRP